VKDSLNRFLIVDMSKTITCDVARFVHSDYGGDLDLRCSISSYIFTQCADAISLKASLQSIVGFIH